MIPSLGQLPMKFVGSKLKSLELSGVQVGSCAESLPQLGTKETPQHRWHPGVAYLVILHLGTHVSSSWGRTQLSFYTTLGLLTFNSGRSKDDLSTLCLFQKCPLKGIHQLVP